MTGETVKTRSSNPGGGPRYVLGDAEFQQLARLVEQRAGLRFSEEKRQELEVRVQDCFLELGVACGAELIRAVRESEAAFQALVNRLTIGESFFFRNQPHFNALRERILPELLRRNRSRRALRIWCAGCACGEEPYSLAILLRESFPETADWDVSILAVDINTDFLKRAEEGVYRRWAFRGVDPRILEKYFRPVDAARFRLDPLIRRAVVFRPYNLVDMQYREAFPEAPFDLLVCRNVLIYFAFERANRVISALGDLAVPGSFLLVGHSEAFPALSGLDAIYSHATYYYQYSAVAGESADKESIAPGPTLSIPGIGVKTIVSRAPAPADLEADPDAVRLPLSVPGLPVAEYAASSALASRAPRALSVAPPPDGSPEAACYDIEGALELARRQVNEGRVRETLDELDVLAGHRGRLDHRVYFLQAIVADQLGETQRALRSLKQAIFLDKGFVMGHFFFGVICQREGRHQDAERSYRNVKQLLGGLPEFQILEEAEGMTAGRLREITEARIAEVRLEMG